MSGANEGRTAYRPSRWDLWGPRGLLFCAWVLKTWEIWRHLTQRHYALWGLYYDTLQMYWISWWTNFTLYHPEHSMYFSTYMNHPIGAPTEIDYGLAWVHTAIAGLLRCLVNSHASHNLVALLGCAVTLAGLFVFLRHLSGSGWLGAALAALIFTFGIGFARTLPDLEVVFFGYTALALLAWIRYMERGGWPRLVLAAVLVAWTCFTQMYYGLPLLMMLGSASVVALVGIAPVDAPPKQAFMRTLHVLVLGLGLGLVSHLGNFAHVMQVSTRLPSTVIEMVPPTRHPVSVWSAVAMLVFLGVTLALGLRARLTAATSWWLLLLPVAILSLGAHLRVTDDLSLTMPFVQLGKLSPILGRLHFTFRFVAPVLLGMGAIYALFWRHRARVMERLPGRWSEGRYAGALVALFWVGAAFGPVVPRFERVPLLEGTPGAQACDAEFPDSCVMTQQWIDLCEPSAGDGAPVAPSPAPLWAIGQVLQPFRPVGTVPVPGPSPCIRYMMDRDDDDALLEFAPFGNNGYLALFQTYHQRPLASFPMFAERYIGRVRATRFAFLPVKYRYDQMEVADLPAAAALAEAGIGWVSLYQGKLRPLCSFVIALGGLTAPWMANEGDFTARYGEPVCRDPVITLYRTIEPW